MDIHLQIVSPPLSPMVNTQFPPLSLLHPPGAPPVRVFTPLHLPSGCRVLYGGGTSIYPLAVASPPPVLLPLHSDPPQLVPPVHEHRPLEGGEVHSLSKLSLHGGGVAGGHSHSVFHSHPALVVVDTGEPQDRFVLLLCL